MAYFNIIDCTFLQSPLPLPNVTYRHHTPLVALRVLPVFSTNRKSLHKSSLPRHSSLMPISRFYVLATCCYNQALLLQPSTFRCFSIAKHNVVLHHSPTIWHQKTTNLNICCCPHSSSSIHHKK